MGRETMQAHRQRRRFPFFMVGKDSTKRIREHFGSDATPLRTTTAIAVYCAINELANDERAEEIMQPRRLLAEYAGIGLKATSDYTAELERAGVIAVERRMIDGVNLPNIITVVEPSQSQGAHDTTPPVEEPTSGSEEPTVVSSGAGGSGSEESLSQEGLLSESGEGEKRAGARHANGSDPEAIPDDFPEELNDHLAAVVPILREVAEQKGAIAVTRSAVARTMMARTRKPLVRAAHDFAAWALGGRGAQRGQKDVVAGWRNWVDRETDLAAPEALPGAPNGHGPPPDVDAARRTRRGAALESVMGGAPAAA